MTSIKRYNEYLDYNELAYEFINSFDSPLNENKDKDAEYQSIFKKFVKDLKLNMALIGTFGTGISVFAPVISKLIDNMNISTEMNIDKVVLLTICSLSIIYLEEKKCKTPQEEDQLTSDSKSMLEELRMMGLGNGIVKMIVKSLKSIKNVFNLIGKHTGTVISGLTDMFAYTSLMIPIMNGIFFIVGKYNLTPETLVSNLIGLLAGFGTIIAKHGINYILNKMKGKLGSKKKDILDDIETPEIQKFALYGSEDSCDGEPINEQ